MKGINAGVPQGSRLGPILFNLYTADQPMNARGCKTLLYADDSLTYATSISPEVAARRVEDHIRQLWEYYLKWGLKINSSKTELICIRTPVSATSGNRNRTLVRRCNSITLSLPDNTTVAPRKTTKYLGINLQEKFKFNEHVDSILKRAAYALHLVHPLLRKRTGLSQKTKLLIYKQLIRPVITYGCPIWLTITPTAMKRICVLERKILRMCTGLHRNPSTRKYIRSERLYEEARIVPIDKYTLQLTSKLLSNLSGHPNQEIQEMLEHPLEPSHRYLHIRAINDPGFDDIFNSDATPFYETNGAGHYRG